MAKGYLIGERFSELDGLPPEQALLKMDKMARKFGHLGKIMDESRKFCCIIGKDKANKILAKDFGSFTGEGLLIGLAAAYFEGRYPVPRPVAYDFPDDGDPDIKWDPTLTPELEVLAHTIGRAILVSLRDDFNYSITERNLNSIIGGKQAKSFVNQFFKGDVSKYLRVTKPSG